MNEDAKVNMLFYRDLHPKEQEKLERMEDAIFHLLVNKLGRTDRPIWTSRTDDGVRFIRLCLFDPKQTVLMEMTADELGGISQDALLSKLVQCSWA